MVMEFLHKLKEEIPELAKKTEKAVLKIGTETLGAEEAFLKLRKVKFDVKEQAGEALTEMETREKVKLVEKLRKVEVLKGMAEKKLQEVV